MCWLVVATTYYFHYEIHLASCLLWYVPHSYQKMRSDFKVIKMYISHILVFLLGGTLFELRVEPVCPLHPLARWPGATFRGPGLGPQALGLPWRSRTPRALSRWQRQKWAPGDRPRAGPYATIWSQPCLAGDLQRVPGQPSSHLRFSEPPHILPSNSFSVYFNHFCCLQPKGRRETSRGNITKIFRFFLDWQSVFS